MNWNAGGPPGLLERTGARNLIDLLSPGDPGASYARILSWLLDPRGEHSLGDELLGSLIDALGEEVEWPGLELSDADTWLGVTERSSSGGRWEIVLWAGGRQLILVQEILGAADLIALTPYRLRGVPIVGLGLTRGSFSPAVQDAIPIWTYEDVIQVLEEVEPSDAHTHFVVEFREHVRAMVQAAQAEESALPPVEAAPAGEPPKEEEISRAEALERADARARAQAIARAEARARAAEQAHAEALARAEALAEQEAKEATADALVKMMAAPAEEFEDPPVTAKTPEPKAEAKPRTPTRELPKGRRILRKQIKRLAEASAAEETLSPIGNETAAMMSEMILSDDGTRAYVMGEVIGVGGQGRVFEATITGDQHFEGFARPVERGVLKMAHADAAEALEREREIYGTPDRGIIRLLDAGKTKRRSYLILERLHAHPFERFAVRVGRVDMATAIDTFVNLLDILKGLHSSKGRDLVLCDIKPDNIMLRMSGTEGTLDETDYLRRLATGAYEPVFIDVGCAQNRSELAKNQGKLPELIGTPLYLPPEAIPSLDGDDFVPGVYSEKTDVYSLTLSFYEHLTGERPYAHRGLFQLRGEDHLRETFAFKRDKVNPINVAKMEKLFGGALAGEFKKILYAGAHPDPEQRASVPGLLTMLRKTFKVEERVKVDEGAYFYDVVRGLRHWQQRFPRLKPEKNIYVGKR